MGPGSHRPPQVSQSRIVHRLTTLGGLTIHGPGGPLSGSAARGRNAALLALLACAGPAGLRHDEIAAMLWPESDAERARGSVDQAIYALRRALDADVIRVAAGVVSLNPTLLASDVADFGAAIAAGEPARAVALYRGPFLEGFHVSGAAEFERWTDARRAELHRRYVEALESLADAATDDPAEAVALRRRIAAADPLDTRAVIGLMRALAAAGDRAGALAAARVHSSLLREELDAEPDPAVVRLAEELRRAPEPAPRPAAEPPLPAAAELTGGVAPKVADGPSHPGEGVHAGVNAEAATLPPRSTTRRRIRPVAGIAIAGALLALALGARSLGILESRPPSAPRLARIAVLPFENRSGDSSLVIASRLAGDWIGDGLVRTGLVQVLDRAAADPAPEALVRGSVDRAGDSIWFRAELVRPADGVVLRTFGPVAAPAREPTRGLDRLRQQVLGGLGTLYDPRLRPYADAVLRPPTYEAYREFAEGMQLWGTGPSAHNAALEHFRRSARLDSTYLQPRLWIAFTLAATQQWASADSAVRSLEPERASMSPLESAWLDRIAALVRVDPEASFRAAERMAQIAPSSGWTAALANAAKDTRRPRLAARVLEAGGPENQGPGRLSYWPALAEAYHMAGDHRRELEVADEAIRTEGRQPTMLILRLRALSALGRVDELRDELARLPAAGGRSPALLRVYAGLARELRAHGGRARDADELLARALAEPPAQSDSTAAATIYEAGRLDEAEALARALAARGAQRVASLGLLGVIAARRGERATAERHSRELAADTEPYLAGHRLLWRARIAAVLGDREGAIELLRRAFTRGARAAWFVAHLTRDFETLRGTPAFVELMSPVERSFPAGARE